MKRRQRLARGALVALGTLAAVALALTAFLRWPAAKRGGAPGGRCGPDRWACTLRPRTP